jgi:hypothetical protein
MLNRKWLVEAIPSGIQFIIKREDINNLIDMKSLFYLTPIMDWPK